MLAARVVPVMLCKGRSLVKGLRFTNDRVVGHVLQAARTHAARGVDELMILDVTATEEGRQPDLGMIEELTDGTFIPVTVGGGVRTIKHIRDLLRAGADKVCIGAAATGDFIREASDHFGAQAIVVSRDHPVAGVDDIEFCARSCRGIVACGAGELLLNNRFADGSMRGYDLDLIRAVSEAVPVPVIACGGCRDYDDMVAAIKAGASAVAVGAFFTFEDATPREAAVHMKANGIEARL